MKPSWAISIAADHAAAVGRLWHFPGLEVLEAENAIWVHTREMSDELEIALRGLPAARRFSVIQGGQLLAAGERVPSGRLPDGKWQPLAQWLTVELAPAALAGKLNGSVPLQVVRWEEQLSGGITFDDPNVLLTNATAWCSYASSAPQARLDRWHFAADGEGRVVVRGAPRPPISGQAYCEREGIAIPIGYVISPAVEPAVVRELVQLEQNDLALFHADGSWERLAAEQFVRATRSAARGIENGKHPPAKAGV